MENLLNFLMLFMIRVLLKPSFLRQHKTDLEQLDSIVGFKVKYLLILVLCHDSMFSSQGHVNSMSITFFKALENIVISGLS